MFWYVMIFIFCLISWVLISYVKDQKAKRMFEIIVVFVLILFSGTRYRLGGYDYGIYENMFYNVNNLSNFDLSFKYGTDILYSFFNSVIKTFGFSFYGFTLIESTIFYILLYRGIRKNNIDFGFFIIIFLYKLCIFNTFVSMRQSLVLVIFLNLIPLIKQKKRVKYLLIITLCSFIHTSALILIPICFIDKLDLSKKGIYIYAGVFFVFFLFNYAGIYKFNPSSVINNFFGENQSITGRNEMYFTTENTVNILSTIETYFILILLLIFYDRILFEKNNEKKIMLNIFLILIPIVTIFRSFEVMVRFRDYFSLSIPFVLFYILESIKNSKNKFLFITIIVIYCFAGYYRYIYTYGDLVPYDTYMFKDGISIKNND